MEVLSFAELKATATPLRRGNRRSGGIQMSLVSRQVLVLNETEGGKEKEQHQRGSFLDSDVSMSAGLLTRGSLLCKVASKDL